MNNRHLHSLIGYKKATVTLDHEFKFCSSQK